MNDQKTIVALTIIGAICMVAGVALIVSGGVGIGSSDFESSTGVPFGLLWAGIAMELIGSSLFAIARRMRWHMYIRSQCPAVIASVQYMTAPPNAVPFPYQTLPPGYTAQRATAPTMYAASGNGAPVTVTGYGNYPMPPMSQAPPPYEPRK